MSAADFARIVDLLVAEACEPPEVPGNLHGWIIGIAERALVEAVLERNRGNQARTAQDLGINRNTLRAIMARHGIAAEPQIRARSYFGERAEFPA